MPESEVNRSVAEREIRDLKSSIDQSNLRRAAELPTAEDVVIQKLRWQHDKDLAIDLRATRNDV